MKALLVLLALFAFSLLMMLSGCSTEQPGTTDTLGNYSTNVSAPPDKVTSAANKACEDLKLENINSNATKVDGEVTAQTAQGDHVTITIAQAGTDVSSVTVRVGTTGDPAMSRQILDRIRDNLSGWL